MSRKVPSWVRWGAVAAVLGGMAVGSLFLYELVRGPRMRDQINLRTFEARMPLPPAGSLPVNPPGPPPFPADETVNPLAASPETMARGRIYYRYYCAFCHGEDGQGHGPVGQSYMPVPSDLRLPKIQAYADGRLLRAALTGIGHEPVLPRIVRPEHRWHLVLYVRTLQASLP